MRVLTWNLERRKIHAPYGKLATQHLFSYSPDIMAITETRVSFPLNEGHTVWAQRPKGHYDEDERKVLLWSKTPWTQIDEIGDADLPEARFISGVTKTNLGEVRVVGICIPYHMANVVHGTKDKKAWEQHIRFLDLLPSILKRYNRPVIIAGDYNQRYPRVRYGNRLAALKMEQAFTDYDIVTKGVIEGMSRQAIDHIAIDKKLRAGLIWGWPNVVDEARLSDHDGSGCDFSLQRAV